MSNHRIIRTVEELEALDRHTILVGHAGNIIVACDSTADVWLPAAVIRDGAEVRAARKALDKETNND